MSRIVIVTGAAAGIGLATARAFAAAGDTVVLTDLSVAAVERQAALLGDRHVGLAMDVSDAAAVDAGIAAVAARFGRIDVLVNNAGIVDAAASAVLDRPIAAVRRLVAVNVEGSYNAARAAGRVMLAQGSGSIVNLSSGAALSALPGRTPYSMTKAAILGITRALAYEWAGQGVRVNAVLPGYVRTEILASLERAGRFDPVAAGAAVPMGRLAEPDEIAAAIVHVAGAGFVTGAAFLVDGGYAAFGARSAAAAKAVSGLVPDGPVVVAGGASDIGAAIADRFVAMGRTVVVLDASVDAIAADRTGVAVDLADEDAVEAALAGIGTVAVLVHAAAQNKTADFAQAFDAGATSAMIVAGAAARGMHGGAIIFLTQGASSHAGRAADAAIGMLVKSLACEWAERGIRVNAVATRGVDDGVLSNPMGRLDEAAAVADAVAFLASDAASYVTGATHVVDGGHAAGAV